MGARADVGSRRAPHRRRRPERWRPAVLAAAVVTVAAGGMAATPAAAAGQRGEVRSLRLASPRLTNLYGDPTDRDVLVYLPPGYHEPTGARYPVVYLLHAFGVGPRSWLGGEGSYDGLALPAVLDSLMGGGHVSSRIVVMPDASTRLGGSWYADSPVSGQWETFIADDVVGFVDRRFRTIPGRHARALVGQSMGAYGALRIGVRNPDTFGTVVAISPVLVENPNPLGEFGARAALEADPTDLARATIPARVLWSRAAAFSPAPDRPPARATLPYRREDGSPTVVAEAWARWEANTLARLAGPRAEALRDVRLRIEVGRTDALRAETEAWSGALRRAGVQHELEVFDGGHVDGVAERLRSHLFQALDAADRAHPTDPNGR